MSEQQPSSTSGAPQILKRELSMESVKLPPVSEVEWERPDGNKIVLGIIRLEEVDQSKNVELVRKLRETLQSKFGGKFVVLDLRCYGEAPERFAALSQFYPVPGYKGVYKQGVGKEAKRPVDFAREEVYNDILNYINRLPQVIQRQIEQVENQTGMKRDNKEDLINHRGVILLTDGSQDKFAQYVQRVGVTLPSTPAVEPTGIVSEPTITKEEPETGGQVEPAEPAEPTPTAEPVITEEPGAVAETTVAQAPTEGLEAPAETPPSSEPAEPQPLTPEQQAEKLVRERFERENAKVDAGKKPNWGGKPKYLREFLKSHGVPEQQIMSWGSTKCFDEAAKILGLERKRQPRAERLRIQEIEERLTKLEQRVAQLEAENQKLREQNQKLVNILAKLYNGEVLSPEELRQLKEAGIPLREEDERRLAEAEEKEKVTAEEVQASEEAKVKEEASEEEVKTAEKAEKAEEAEKAEAAAELPAETASPKKPEKKGFIAKFKNFLKNWWKSISPQGRNKWCWGFGVAIGALEQLGLRPLLTPIIGPAAGWAVSGVNALAIQGVNYRLQKGITEAKARGDAERLAKLEKAYQRYSDVVAGISAGSFGSAIAQAIWEAFVVPRLPTLLPEVFAVEPTPPVEKVITPPPGGAAPSPVTPGAEVVTPPATPPPVEKVIRIPVAPSPVEGVMHYIVRPGDTVSEILARLGRDPYGPDLTRFIINNAELLASKGPEYAEAVALVKAHPDWVARGGTREVWRIIMKAARLIHPGDKLIIP